MPPTVKAAAVGHKHSPCIKGDTSLRHTHAHPIELPCNLSTDGINMFSYLGNQYRDGLVRGVQAPPSLQCCSWVQLVSLKKSRCTSDLINITSANWVMRITILGALTVSPKSCFTCPVRCACSHQDGIQKWKIIFTIAVRWFWA